MVDAVEVHYWTSLGQKAPATSDGGLKADSSRPTNRDVASSPLPANAVFRELTLSALRDLGGRAHRDAIRDRALALGQFTKDQLAVPPPSTHTRYGSRVEYLLSWSLTWLKRDGEVR